MEQDVADAFKPFFPETKIHLVKNEDGKSLVSAFAFLEGISQCTEAQNFIRTTVDTKVDIFVAINVLMKEDNLDTLIPPNSQTVDSSIIEHGVLAWLKDNDHGSW
jgi:hypothetical protein